MPDTVGNGRPTEPGLALAEGLYWLAEKLMWGYEDVQKDPSEALKLYHQAAGLGWSDAHIRIGEFHEHGRGGKPDAGEALASYKRAAEAGNYLALAFIAKLLSRTIHREKATAVWDRFFAVLRANPNPNFVAETVGGLLHAYIEAQLQRGAEPKNLDIIRQHRLAVIGRHQQMLEHATSLDQLNRLEQVGDWHELNLRGG